MLNQKSLVTTVVLFAGSITGALLSGLTCVGTTPQGPEDELVLGSESARLTVIEYADLECPVCGRFARETFPTIRARYIDTGKVRWVYRHFPLTRPHPHAWKAAEASQCAYAQGRFWEYTDLLFSHQSALEIADLKVYAGELGLDQSSFDACLDAGGEAAQVQADQDAGVGQGVAGTPTFVINGQNFPGFHSVEEMSAVLDSYLE